MQDKKKPDLPRQISLVYTSEHKNQRSRHKTCMKIAKTNV